MSGSGRDRPFSYSCTKQYAKQASNADYYQRGNCRRCSISVSNDLGGHTRLTDPLAHHGSENCPYFPLESRINFFYNVQYT